MSEIFNYLNSPYLVANFQKIFGIESNFNHDEPRIETQKKHQQQQQQQKNSSNEQLKETDELKNRKKPDEKNESDSSGTELNVETIGPKLVTNETNTKKHKRQSSLKTLINGTDHSHIVANTTIHNQFWYYFFHVGAEMGNELFYILFFPFWFWNVDSAIGRKVGLLWGVFMYLGQATKDLLCMPRPASPPVVKLEDRYKAEYGFPSTHAMVAAGLPISVVVLSYSRYNINLPVSIGMAAVFCCWVCCSRLYLGMHSLLDVIAGVLFSILMLVLCLPILEPVDTFIIQNKYSPQVTIVFGYLICYFYPSLKQWSTARGDTTIIIGSVVGFSVGSFLNHYLGYMNKPSEPPLYDIQFPNAVGYIHGVVRTILGLFLLLCVRQFFKSTVLRLLCKLNKLDRNDPACKKNKSIELPYNYITYFVIGSTISFGAPFFFRLLRINRDYSFTEL